MMLLPSCRHGIVSQLTRSLAQSGYGRAKAAFPQLLRFKLNLPMPLLTFLRRTLFDDATREEHIKGAFFNQSEKQLKGEKYFIWHENLLNSLNLKILLCDGAPGETALLKEALEDVIQIIKLRFNLSNEVNSWIVCENFPQLATPYMAVHYKLNTMNAFEEAYKVYQLSQMAETKSNQMNEPTVAFLLALAMNQKQFEIVLEIIRHFPVYQHTVLFNSIRMQAYAELGEFSEVSYQLKYQVLHQKRLIYKEDKSPDKFIYKQTLTNIEQIIRARGQDLCNFQGLVKQLNQHRLIEKDCTLEKALFKPMEKKCV